LHNGKAVPPERGGQVAAFWAHKAHRFLALRCGRRFGKTDFDKTVACDAATKSKSIGWFAPDYKRLSEAYNEIATILKPVRLASSKVDGVYRTITGGRIDFWTLEDPDAGRSRKYHGVVIDEGAFTKPNMMATWEKAIKPTLLDYGGWAIASSNTNGIADDNFFYAICHEPKYGFADCHFTTFDNPFLPEGELAKLQAENHPLVFKQEYLAEFVDWSGVQFFALVDCLENGEPVAYPAKVDAVFATIDTAVKTGKDHDATAVVYWSYSKVGRDRPQLVILDWDVVQVEGSLLEAWLPGVYKRLEELAAATGARAGSLGAFIEDKASGTILLQQAKRRNWRATAIDSKLTSLGKDERAINVSGYVYRGQVRLSAFARDKVSIYKGRTANHFMKQVFGYRLGIKDQEDDALDCFCYGIAVGLGNVGGF
jgi:phage terminase large subunit-like protein